ncbi:hypothetical protein V6N13_148852 [Hibiscus sabdariffa]
MFSNPFIWSTESTPITSEPKFRVLQDKTLTWGSDKRQKVDAFRPGLRCFLCKGPYLVAECPKRSSLNALRTTIEESNENDDPLDYIEEGPARAGSIRFLYALHSKLDKAKFEKAIGLMYVDIELNGVASKALVETGQQILS